MVEPRGWWCNMLKRPGEPDSGAILVFTAVLLLVLIGFAALAVDLGNAWSTNRQSQTAADIAATSGLFAIPRTFADVAGAPAPIVTDAVQAEIDDLNLTNAPGSIATATVSADARDLTVDLSIDSNNSFARAIGAGNSISVANTASGHIELPEISEPNIVRPFGLFNQPNRAYQCLLVSIPVVTNRPAVCQAVEGDDMEMLEMFNLDPVVRCSSPSTVSNLRDGIDHLIDTDTISLRSAQDACDYGHVLTLPNAAETQIPSTGQLTSGLTQGGGPLASPSPPLWEFLVPGLPNPCNDVQISSQPTLEQQSNAMRLCLQGGAPSFQAGVVDSRRFSFAVKTSAGPGGIRTYDAITLVFLHTIVSDDPSLPSVDDAQTLNGPPAGSGNVGAFTLYELDIDDLAAADQAALMPPFGTDELVFSLTD